MTQQYVASHLGLFCLHRKVVFVFHYYDVINPNYIICSDQDLALFKNMSEIHYENTPVMEVVNKEYLHSMFWIKN